MGLRLFKKTIKVATHNGSFHADDVFAVATLSMWADKYKKQIEIIRTRDQEKISKADIVVDVGGIYDPEKNRFDHHQRETVAPRENGVPYASFGLVWKKFGTELCSKDTAVMIDNKLGMSIDARDNGINISVPENNKFGLPEYRITNVINAFRPVHGSYEAYNRQFKKAVTFAREVLKGEIDYSEAEIEGEKKAVVAISKQDDPEILIFDEIFEWERAVSKNENTKFVVHPDSNGRDWDIEASRSELEDYTSGRATFPEKWRGLRDKDLEKASGVAGTIFCHKGGFFGVAKTKEAAIEIAKKALGK